MEQVPDEIEFLTVEDICGILKVSRQTVYKYIWRDENPLPVVYLNKNTPRVLKEKFKEWIECLDDPRRDV